MQSFGYETLISILLPGFTLLGAAWLLVARFAPASMLNALFTRTATSEWQFSLFVILGSALLGSLLASVLELVEWRIFDRWTAKRLGIDPDLYDEEWYWHVETLADRSNPYLDRKTVYFFFELRAGVAILLLSVVGLVVSARTPTTYVLTAAGLGSAFVLLYIAAQTHTLLAFWRDRNFQQTAGKPLTQDRSSAHGTGKKGSQETSES